MREGFCHRTTFEQRPPGCKGLNHKPTWRECSSGGKAKCQRSEKGVWDVGCLLQVTAAHLAEGMHVK